MRDPIIEELHRHREDLLREHGNDPQALVRFLQAEERASGRPLREPPATDSDPSRIRFARR
jgi:hypothetical protein